MAVINQFSFVAAAGLGGLVLAVALWRWQSLPLSPAPRVAVFVLYVVVMVALLFRMRYPQENTADAPATVDNALTNGRPTFIMLYSNY